jgi:hypothetical protein
VNLPEEAVKGGKPEEAEAEINAIERKPAWTKHQVENVSILSPVIYDEGLGVAAVLETLDQVAEVGEVWRTCVSSRVLII